MPLPLPNLDTRRWADLVEEGRALIPRYAPAWTDHNVHDPGVTLLELFAWLVEQDIYRANRVTDRHRLKFLSLVGYAPEPPRPALTALTFSLSKGAGQQALPAGVVLAGDAPAESAPPRFRTLAPLNVIPARLRAVQVFDGAQLSDQTLFWRERLPFSAWGANPQAVAPSQGEPGPALYLGFDSPLPPGVQVSLWLSFAAPRSNFDERARIGDEACPRGCRPWWYPATCPPAGTLRDGWCAPEEVDGRGAAGGAPAAEALKHHSVRAAWEYYDGGAWRALDAAAGEVVDDTRGLTLDGPVKLTLPGPISSRSLGRVADPLFYLRCRLAAGRPDAAPALRDVALNTVAAEQAVPVSATFKIAPGVSPSVPPAPGLYNKLNFSLDGNGVVTSLEVADADAPAPAALVLGYKPATLSSRGELSVTMALVGRGSGLPSQQFVLPHAPVAHGEAHVWTVGPGGARRWRQVRDLDASTATDTDFTCDASSGVIAFGDGGRGRVVPADEAVVAGYDVTLGAAGGGLKADALWTLSGEDAALNRALLKAEPALVSAAFEGIVNRAPAAGGADAEELEEAAGRAAETQWAHERLVELCSSAHCTTLDQIERGEVLARRAPGRATTLADFERLALDVPGTSVVRARAWAGLDPRYPGLEAPGTVALVVVPELPPKRPQPTPGLLRAVKCYLDCRRVVCTRLVVVGPRYLEVSVRARVCAARGASAARVRERVVAGLDRFLDPLAGGPQGRGWPFGRDVYRSEILQVIDGTDGVDHVLEIELVADGEAATCGNVCVGPVWLVTPGAHAIEVV